MREIKFRVWNKKAKQMEYITPFDNGADWGDEICIPNDDKNSIVMQFTGLKDFNGKEIYDSDIVNIKHPDDKGGDFENTNGMVFWDEREGGWYHGNSEGRPPKRMWEYAEVVGNIWENTELLNKKI